MSDSVWPHRLQPTRLPRPWDFPGRSTGVGCHCLLHHHRRVECKSRKSRDTWSNRQIWPCNTKWSRAKACRVFSREHTGHSKPLFQKPNRPLYTWTSPDGQFWNQIDYILCSQRWRNSIQSAKTIPGADCGLAHELLIAKFRLKLKKVGKPLGNSVMT